MIDLTFTSGKTYAVFGLSRTGRSALRTLKGAGAKVVAWDDNSIARHSVASDFGVTCTPHDEWNWNAITALVLSPGIPFTHPAPHPVVIAAQAAGIEVISDLELFVRALGPKKARRAPVVAITGTNGKSTSTALVGHVLNRGGFSAQVGGNIGKPALDLEPPSPNRVYVLEVSSYQIDLTPSLTPDVGVLLNISPDHLERHRGMDGYARAKEALFRGQSPRDHAIIGIDDAYASAIYARLRQAQLGGDGAQALPITIGRTLGRGIYVVDGHLMDATMDPALDVCDLRKAPTLPGAHNWQNAAAAYAIARTFKMPPGDIADAIESFPGLAHRQELVAQTGGIRFVNDSKATNPDAAARALAAYDHIYWIAGGRAKEGGIASLEQYFPKIVRAYLIGEAADDFAATLNGDVDCKTPGTLDAAVKAAFTDAARTRGAATILLSPACASFDQFTDYEARGEAFRKAAQACVSQFGQDAQNSQAQEAAR